jgi:hypothetical protein
MARSSASNTEVNKVFVSSSHRVSGSNGSWRYEVPGDSLECGPDAVLSVADVAVPHSWYNLNGSNNRMYLRQRTQVSPTLTMDYTTEVPAANYTASQLSTTLASLMSGLSGANYTCSFSQQTHKFSIQESGGNGFMLLSDKNLRDYGWNVIGTNLNALRSLNTILATPDVDVPDTTAFSVTFTGAISVMIRFPSIHLHCAQLSGGTIAEDGSRGVIRRISITTDMGEL